jgi:2-phospho-L-lactate guanylyltransferase (CobY/MobA/RfbA family)
MKMSKPTKQKIEQEIRAEITGTSASNKYVVYLNTEHGSNAAAHVIYEGDLETAIKSFLDQIDDEGVIIKTNYTLVGIDAIEKFSSDSTI